jgi:5-formyltetrahydrofolate cyclo-ligase
VVTKAALRALIRERLRADPRRDGAAVADHLAAAWPSGLLCLYLAMGDELDLDAFAAALAASGRLVLPRVEGETLRLVEVTDLATQVEGERLRQPAPRLPEVRPDVIVVPGRAFDLAGRRLGRGRGHYDRLLASLPGVPTVGVCLDAQLVDEVPVDAWDRPVDAVLTPAGWARR